jgi:transposase-like protein
MDVYNNYLENGLDSFVLGAASNYIASLLNTLLLHERESFRLNYPFAHFNGFYERSLKLKFGKIALTVPRVREGGVPFTVFEKYNRNTDGLNAFISSLYSGRIFEKEICNLVDLAAIPDVLKDEIKKEYLAKYKEFIERPYVLKS